MKKPLIVIGGPTASGKTKVSVAVAKKIGGEIISADSMQVYRYMDVGTAKPTAEEMDGVTHYLIDELLPDEEFNVVIFQEKAKAYMEQIYKKGKIPILVGGTGFYIQALVNDISFMETESDPIFRKNLYEQAEIQGSEYIHDLLKKVDPISAENIHANNTKKVVRALEYYHLTKQPISLHNQLEKQKTSPYHTTPIILTMERQMLYSRIEERIDLMLRMGLIEEVQQLLNLGYSPNLVSMQGLGYKEIIQYLRGEWTLDEAVDILKRDTRRFAKRQLTWFRGQCEGYWLDVDKLGYNLEEITSKIIKHIEEFGIVI